MSGLLTIGECLALGVADTGVAFPHAHGLRLGIGGAESNVAVGVARLGAPAAWVGCVGDDGPGQRVVRELTAEGLGVHARVVHEVPTAFMLKERRIPGAGRVTYYRSGMAGSRLRPEDVDPALVAAADVLHVTGITPGLSSSAHDAVRTAVQLAGEHGTRVSFDVNHRAGVWRDRDPRPVYRELAAAADVVFAGEDEARLLVDADDLLGAVHALGGADVVLKRGADGCSALVAEGRYDVAAVRVDVVDTVGAGDAFVAGYLAEWLAGADVPARLATAVRCGAFACLSDGDWEGAPTRRDLALLGAAEPVVR